MGARQNLIGPVGPSNPLVTGDRRIHRSDRRNRVVSRSHINPPPSQTLTHPHHHPPNPTRPQPHPPSIVLPRPADGASTPLSLPPCQRPLSSLSLSFNAGAGEASHSIPAAPPLPAAPEQCWRWSPHLASATAPQPHMELVHGGCPGPPPPSVMRLDYLAVVPHWMPPLASSPTLAG